MSKKYLGKVAAGGALASAALLVAAPGIASASTTPSTWGGDHKEDHGYIKTYPKWVRPGDEVKIIEVCSEEQEYAKVWSKATGKVELERWKPRPHDGGRMDDAAPEDGWGQDQADGQDHWSQDGRDGKGDEHGRDGKDGKDHKKHYVYVGEAYVKEYVHPGWYKVKGECGYGKIHVVEAPGDATDPQGPVAGGDGGLTGANTNLAAGGAAALAAAAFGGVFMVRRRRTDGAQV
ncbi:hypothetical protein SAMN05421678_109182 [Actinopolymorpha cephalotaxi]|uniref:Gram-positive cocci surface proteins LPxTG domain-containing protein n=1 Tax=Actinopolymorpha cephalotaxi TaxID=504797 RepID=A0A1I2VHA3_9ACTN|nr:hypothetical protein [Actinopolymorpha cephalotaxi]NYH83325.1 hypothetical protein [Actinopolymorpha cephalotaxi]SFG88705.1 hypothetical protein SAMN05421678_109182 [Actinopolymorpha cephalotaxi]